MRATKEAVDFLFDKPITIFEQETESLRDRLRKAFISYAKVSIFKNVKSTKEALEKAIAQMKAIQYKD